METIFDLWIRAYFGMFAALGMILLSSKGGIYINSTKGELPLTIIAILLWPIVFLFLAYQAIRGKS